MLRALTCDNPQCAGRNKSHRGDLFANRIPGVSIGSEGNIIWPEVDTETLIAWDAPACPRCAQARWVVPYLTTENVRRRQELKDELTRSRQARESLGKEAAAYEHRMPVDIMKEISSIPAVYIRDEDANM